MLILLKASGLLLGLAGCGAREAKKGVPGAPEDTADTGDPDTGLPETGDSETAPPDTAPDDTSVPPVDADGDGYLSDVDCDDADPSVNPGAAEVCGDGVDNDCSGGIACRDEGAVKADGADAILVDRPDGPWAASLARFIGDHDGDGMDELAVKVNAGVEGNPYAADIVVVSPTAGEVDLTLEFDARVRSMGIGEYEGHWMFNHSIVADGQGDANGDGLSDLAIAEPAMPPDDPPTTIWLMYGPTTGTPTFSDGDASLQPDAPYSYYALGLSLAWAGETNGDGWDDLVAGDYIEPDHAGSAWLLRGPFTGHRDLLEVGHQWVGEERGSWDGYYKGDLAGLFVNGGGDVNADGFDDVIVYAPTPGNLYLLYGPATSAHSLEAADSEIASVTIGHFGTATNRSDVDGDGYSDIVSEDPLRVGAEDSDIYSLFIVLYGPIAGDLDAADTLDRVVDGPGSPRDDPLASGDVDGDGFADVLTATGDDTTHLFYGPIEGNVTDWSASIAITDPSGDWGRSTGVALGGDSDGNGQQDILVASWWYTGGGSFERGAAALFFGVEGG